MSIIQGIILGILQGIAEFLPVSSSGHLALAQHLFGIGEVPLLFDVFLHLATLCSVLLFFRKKIAALFCVLGRLIARRPCPDRLKNPDGTITQLSTQEASEKEAEGRRYILGVILATIVTGVIGIFVEKKLGTMPLKFICAGFIVTAALLIASSVMENRREPRPDCAPSLLQSLIIGTAQGLGTLPGISRSGITISAALFCGVTRPAAGEFSFIASIPAILGAFILELKDLGEIGSTVGAEPVIAGCAAAFASGYIALTLLMKIIRGGKLSWFACYLIPAGILGLLFL